jgi:hypothetical protein
MPPGGLTVVSPFSLFFRLPTLSLPSVQFSESHVPMRVKTPLLVRDLNVQSAGMPMLGRERAGHDTQEADGCWDNEAAGETSTVADLSVTRQKRPLSLKTCHGQRRNRASRVTLSARPSATWCRLASHVDVRVRDRRSWPSRSQDADAVGGRRS